jgi:hypothetical protein
MGVKRYNPAARLIQTRLAEIAADLNVAHQWIDDAKLRVAEARLVLDRESEALETEARRIAALEDEKFSLYAALAVLQKAYAEDEATA